MEGDLVDEVLAHVDNAQPEEPAHHPHHSTQYQEEPIRECQKPESHYRKSPKDNEIWNIEDGKSSALVSIIVFVASLPQFRQMMHSVPFFSGAGTFGQASIISVLAFVLYYAVLYVSKHLK